MCRATVLLSNVNSDCWQLISFANELDSFEQWLRIKITTNVQCVIQRIFNGNFARWKVIPEVTHCIITQWIRNRLIGQILIGKNKEMCGKNRVALLISEKKTPGVSPVQSSCYTRDFWYICSGNIMEFFVLSGSLGLWKMSIKILKKTSCRKGHFTKTHKNRLLLFLSASCFFGQMSYFT